MGMSLVELDTAISKRIDKAVDFFSNSMKAMGSSPASISTAPQNIIIRLTKSEEDIMSLQKKFNDVLAVMKNNMASIQKN